MEGLYTMKGAGVAVVGLAIVVLMGIAVVGGFKQTGLIDNDTADLFITGLTYFGLFVGVLVIAIVGKIIIGMFSGK